MHAAIFYDQGIDYCITTDMNLQAKPTKRTAALLGCAAALHFGFMFNVQTVFCRYYLFSTQRRFLPVLSV